MGYEKTCLDGLFDDDPFLRNNGIPHLDGVCNESQVNKGPRGNQDGFFSLNAPACQLQDQS